MNISPEERASLNKRLTELMESSQRSLVSLRKNDFDNLALNVDQLTSSISAFMVEVGADLLSMN